MFKERAIDFDWGLDIGDNHLYSPNSANATEDYMLNYEWANSADLHKQRGIGVSTAIAPYGGSSWGPDGMESFRATEYPKPRFNSVDHLVNKGVNYPVTYAALTYRNRFQLFNFWRYEPNITGLTADLEIVPVNRHLGADLRNAQATAWGTMQPRFEGDISMFNFLVELRDFKSLFVALRNKPWKRLGRYFKRLKRKGVDPTKPLAQARLTSEFALKPLISDIVKITAQISETVTAAQQDFADAGAESSSRHYTETFNGSFNSTVSAAYAKYQPFINSGNQEHMKFTATMQYTYMYSQRGTVNAIMRYWGLNPTPEAIWNAIPFSFLFDYVIGIGDAIRVMDRDKRVELSLHQYCESYLTTRNAGIYVRPDFIRVGILGTGRDSFEGSLPISDILVAGVTSSLYSRRVTSPNKGLVIPRLRTPTSKQGWNCAALLRCFF